MILDVARVIAAVFAADVNTRGLPEAPRVLNIRSLGTRQIARMKQNN